MRNPQNLKHLATHSAFQWSYTAILLSSFLVGFIGLGFEMLWVRILHIVNKSTAYSFPSILFIFLLGLALGGYIFGRQADKSKNPVLLFCKIELTGAAIAALTLLTFWWSLEFKPPWIQDFFETQKPGLPFVKIQKELYLLQTPVARQSGGLFPAHSHPGLPGQHCAGWRTARAGPYRHQQPIPGRQARRGHPPCQHHRLRGRDSGHQLYPAPRHRLRMDLETALVIDGFILGLLLSL